MKHPLCLIMLGGDAPGALAARELSLLLEQSPYVVAADKGAEHLLQLGIMPHLLVGDGDSLSPAAREACLKAGTKFLSLPRRKDLTDGEAALSAALNVGNRLAVFGAFGGRVDHLLGNLLAPLACQKKWESCIFYGEGFTVKYCFGDTLLRGKPGDTVSMVALSPTVENITLQGFCYPLLNHVTTLGSSRCLSNELKEPTGHISFDAGIMLIIHYSGHAA
ncbi:MAG: thiamine diphosphokinase [Clostridiales bacterium]|nr:thiamine diphosphokinase [Clostridiales bacterium]